MNTKPIKSKQNMILLLFSLLSFLSFQLNLEYTDQTGSIAHIIVYNLLDFFQEYNFLYLFIFPALYYFYQYVHTQIHGTDLIYHPSVILPAILFALFMVVGYSFAQTDSFNLIKGIENGQLIKVCFKTAGYAIFFYFVISFLFYKINLTECKIDFTPPHIKNIQSNVAKAICYTT